MPMAVVSLACWRRAARRRPARRPHAPAGAAAARSVATVAEAFLTPMTPADNIDSPASWTAPDGKQWLIATAKTTDKLVVYDGQTGAHLRDVGSQGTAPGQFDRPNGIAVIDDLVLVVERDNHRVQVLHLPDFTPLGVFAAADLRKPYGLWVNKQREGYDVYVTDSYDAGEDAQGNDVLPPLAELDKRVRRYALTLKGERAGRDPGGQHRRHQRGRRAARGRIDLGRPGQRPPVDCRGRRDLRQRDQGLHAGRPLHRYHVWPRCLPGAGRRRDAARPAARTAGGSPPSRASSAACSTCSTATP